MESETDIENLSIQALSNEAKELLSRLLNSKKTLPTDGPEKLPRDWRGLASVVNITSETVSFISTYPNFTDKVLEIWSQNQNGTATIGKLFKHLQRLDRYDVYDDLQALSHKGSLISYGSSGDSWSDVRPVNSLAEIRNDLITIQDVQCQKPQYYHAYVLHSVEDEIYVDELINVMKENNLKICTEMDLQSSFQLQHKVIAELISERCHRVIIICSEAFFNSPKSSFNTYYMDYAQAIGIERKAPKIIPCIYGECTLPASINFYHKLYYPRPGQKVTYNFWEKIILELKKIDLESKPDSHAIQNGSIDASNFLALPNDGMRKSTSLNALEIASAPGFQLPSYSESASLNSLVYSENSGVKKKSKMSKMLIKLIRRKDKRKQAAIAVQ